MIYETKSIIAHFLVQFNRKTFLFQMIMSENILNNIVLSLFSD